MLSTLVSVVRLWPRVGIPPWPTTKLPSWIRYCRTRGGGTKMSSNPLSSGRYMCRA